MAHFQGLVDRQPDNEMFRFSLGQALLAEGRDAEALAHLEFCAQRKTDWMMPRILLGKSLLKLGRKEPARLVLTEALALARAQQHEDPERELRALLAEF